MDSGDMEYPNGSELGEIFAALESLKQELQMMKEPMGTKGNPARSCRDLWLCHQDFPDGDYWIDPNGGCNKDAIQVECQMSNKGTTCLKPAQDGAKQSRWPKETAGAWFSEYSKGFEINYNVTDPQFKFLRLLSSKATQRFVYECSSSVGWFDEVSGNHDKAVQLMAYNDDVVSYAPDEQRFTVQDSCATGDKNGRVEINSDTRDVDILPIKDFRAFDIGDKSKKFGFTIEPVLKMPKASGFFSCLPPHTSPSITISDLILRASASKSVSSSNGLTSSVIIDLAATAPLVATLAAFLAL